MSFKTVKLTILLQDDVGGAKKSQKEPLNNRIVRLTNEFTDIKRNTRHSSDSIATSRSSPELPHFIRKGIAWVRSEG